MNWQAVPAVLKVAVPLAIGGVLAGAIALGATSGGNNDGAPQAAAATPTPVPEATRAPTAAPVKTELGPRTDCPKDWTYYNDPDGHFSFCHPLSLRVTVAEGVPGGGQVVSIDTPPDRLPPAVQPDSIVFTAYWKPQSAYQRGLISSRCATAFDPRITKVEESIAAARQQVVACRGVGTDSVFGTDPLALEVPDPLDGGWIQVYAFQRGPNLQTTGSTINQILESLRIHGQP